MYCAIVLGMLPHVSGGVSEQSLHVFLSQMFIGTRKERAKWLLSSNKSSCLMELGMKQGR